MDEYDRIPLYKIIIGTKKNIKTLAIIAGLLVLFGAGCSKNVPAQQEQNSTNIIDVEADQATDKESANTVKSDGICYSSSVKIPASFQDRGIWSVLTHFENDDSDGSFDNEAETIRTKLMDLYASGWNVDEFCVLQKDNNRMYYFSMYAFWGDALKEDAVKLLPNTEVEAYTLTRLGYASNGSLILSKPFGVGRFENVAINAPYKLSLIYDDLAPSVSAEVSDRGWKYKINFLTDSQTIDNLHFISEE